MKALFELIYCMQRCILFLRLRLSQEVVMLRYAFLCQPGSLVTSFIFLRFLGLFLTFLLLILFGITFALGHSPVGVPVYSACVGLYLFLMVNALFERGITQKRLKRWKNGFLILIVLQTTLVSAFSVLESVGSTSYEQVRALIVTRTLPGGVTESDVQGMKILSLDVSGSITPTENTQADSVAVTPKATVEEGPVQVVGRALNYPNPCRLGAEGTTIGYELSKDSDVELRIYDPFAHEIYRESFFAGQPGGRGGSSSAAYNRVSVTAAKLKSSNVPAGIYFYVLISGENKLLAKGKIAALP